MAKHFSYAQRISELHELCRIKGAPPIVPKLDKNGTRIMAVWRLLYSMLRLWKAIIPYVDGFNSKCRKESELLPVISYPEWEEIAEMEAVLNVTRTGCFVSQYESHYTGISLSNSNESIVTTATKFCSMYIRVIYYLIEMDVNVSFRWLRNLFEAGANRYTSW